jgi:hypothetical protein
MGGILGTLLSGLGAITGNPYLMMAGGVMGGGNDPFVQSIMKMQQGGAAPDLMKQFGFDYENFGKMESDASKLVPSTPSQGPQSFQDTQTGAQIPNSPQAGPPMGQGAPGVWDNLVQNKIRHGDAAIGSPTQQTPAPVSNYTPMQFSSTDLDAILRQMAQSYGY